MAGLRRWNDRKRMGTPTSEGNRPDASNVATPSSSEAYRRRSFVQRENLRKAEQDPVPQIEWVIHLSYGAEPRMRQQIGVRPRRGTRRYGERRARHRHQQPAPVESVAATEGDGSEKD